MARKPAKKPQVRDDSQPVFQPNINFGGGRVVVTDAYGAVWLIDSDSGTARKVQFPKLEEEK